MKKTESYEIWIFAHNEVKTLPHVIEDIRKQTNNIIHIICNGSTDGTVELSTHFSKSDSKIKIHTLPEANKIKAWNYANTHLKTNITIFCDADIRIPHHTLSNLYEKITNEEEYEIIGCLNKPLNTTILTRLLLFNPKPIFTGRCYIMRKKKIQIPTNLIHEDLYLKQICKTKVSKDQTIIQYKAPTLSEWFYVEKRRLINLQKLKILFPHFQNTKRPIAFIIRNNRLTYYILSRVTRYLCRLYARRVTIKKWYRAASTKQ
ncbi:MAG: glycosyltransferase involved in cell wall biosynthesis [Candidatus Woesearchaeota archaeon]|jgi:glycosyltransferase involved in cell wall biosynthesis